MSEPNNAIAVRGNQEQWLLVDGALPTTRGKLATLDENLDGVSNDAQALLAWLSQFRERPNTLRAYRRGVGALRIYLDRIGLCFSSLTRPVAQEFACWLGTEDCAHPHGPFTKVPSERSREQIIGACQSFYRHMHESGYLIGNPFRISLRRPMKSTSLTTQRFLDSQMIEAVLAEIADMPARESARWSYLFAMMVQLAARRSEMSNGTRADLFQDFDGNWWWRVTGKGNKIEEIPVDARVMDLMAQYDKACGFDPADNEQWKARPLFPSRQGKAIGAGGIYAALKRLFAKAACRLPADAVARRKLEGASPHWLRHTGLSLYAQKMNLSEVAFIGRHSSVNTTRQYVHRERKEVHRMVQGIVTDVVGGAS